MTDILDFLNYKLYSSGNKSITVGVLLTIVVFWVLAYWFFTLSEKIIKRRLEEEDRNKFDTIFSFVRWLIYITIFLSILNSVGFKITAIFASAAALLVGVGLALQTWFQDIMSGVFIITDKSVRVGDIIELDNKVGRVVEIKLRTTRAVTMDNKVLIIPNHLYLIHSLYNWTQNGKITRESVSVGVAYGSDTELVKKLLIRAAKEHHQVLKNPPPMVLFTNFGDSSLDFKLSFTLRDSFMAVIPQSDIRFTIDRLFREHNISIPFPQRDVHIINQKTN